VRVLDAFHVVRLGFAAVDKVRRRIQREQTGHRGRTGDPLYGIRRLLRRRHDHHCDRSWARLLAGLDAGDTTDEQLARTWIAAQDLRLIYHEPDRNRAAAALYRWLAYCADADIPELTRLARTIDSWHAEFLAYFDTGGVSNGPTEAANLLIKDQASRPRIPQLGQLPAPPTAALRRRLEHYPHHADQRTATTLSGVEPVIGLSSRRA
jgi:transposase